MIMVLNRQDNTKIPYIIPGHGDYRIETWDKGSDSVRRTFALFRGKVVPESGTWLLRKILIAYCQALDSPQWEDIFIGLWRIMEYLILHDRSDYQSLRTVRAKIAQATGGGDFESRVLEAIEMKRHHLVHKGQFEQEMGNDIVMSTKYFVEKTILFLEKRRRQIVDMDYLDLYLNSMSEKNERLDKRIRVMKTIKEERQEKTREPKDKNTSKAAESPPEAKGKGQG
jgi:hypothetical protein